MEKEDEKMGEVKIESIKKKKGWDKKTEDETVFLLLFKGGWLSKWYFPNSSHKDSYCVLPQKSKGIGYYPLFLHYLFHAGSWKRVLLWSRNTPPWQVNESDQSNWASRKLEAKKKELKKKRLGLAQPA